MRALNAIGVAWWHEPENSEEILVAVHEGESRWEAVERVLREEYEPGWVLVSVEGSMEEPDWE